MRQMAGDGEYEIVMLGIHDLHIRAASAPGRFELFDRRLIAPWRGRQNAPASLEELGKARQGARLLRPRDRMAGNEMDALRHMWRHIANDRLLHRAHIG